MKQIILFLTIGLILPSAFGGGNGVSNGGGFAQCEDHQFYAYDYLLTLDVQSFGPDIQNEDIQISLLQIASQLKRLQDPLAKNFDLFISSMFKQTPGSPYQWFMRQNLQLMLDPGLASALPRACSVRAQAVYFTAPFAGVPYTAYVYDSNLIHTILSQQNGAVQVSYLWVHEWLWNYYDHGDFQKLAVFNRLLHSKKLFSISPAEFSKWRPAVTISN
jgi:hypothetical protein